MKNYKIPGGDKKLLDENRKLRSAVAELSILNDIATTITSTQQLEELVDMIVKKCVKHLKVEQGAVMLLDEEDKEKPFHTMIRQQDSKSNILPYRLDNQLTGWMLKNQAPLLTNDLKNDERFKAVMEQDTPINSLLSVPLLLKGKMIGILTVFNKHPDTGFTADDQRLLAIIAAQSAHIIENARLYNEEQKLLMMREEMRLARETQLNLLPKDIPSIPGYTVFAKTISAKEVGGDYYDIIKIDDNNIAFCLGDVTGKGMSAAMLMANIQATLRAQIINGCSCTESLYHSNNLLCSSTEPAKFVTLFLGILNTKSNEVCYSNAGHDPPLFFSDTNINQLDAGGLLLGSFADSPYEQEKLVMNPGDLLVLYSDGITEAMNEEDQEFGEEELLGIIKNNKDTEPDILIEEIISTVKEHSGSSPQSDDMTLMMIKRNIE